MSARTAVVACVVSCLVAALVAFALGRRGGERAMVSTANIQLDGVQADLAFNRFLNERKWKGLLDKGCVSQAAASIDIAEDKDMELLASYLNEKLNADSVNYIVERDPTLIARLKTFRSKYGAVWSEEPCGK